MKVFAGRGTRIGFMAEQDLPEEIDRLSALPLTDRAKEVDRITDQLEAQLEEQDPEDRESPSTPAR